MDIGAPCKRVKFHLVVDDLGTCIGGGHQVEALNFISGCAEACRNPVPDDLGAIMDNIKGGNSWDCWGVDNALEVYLLARECNSAELEKYF